MLNTELFIMEVQKRPCLWNTKDNSYGDRELKLQAWNKIAELLNESSQSYSLTNTNITVEDLQRRWKHLRDYNTRERKLESKIINTKINSSVSNKRKSYLLNTLQFLNVNPIHDKVKIIPQRNSHRLFIKKNYSQKTDVPEEMNISNNCEESSQSKFQSKENQQVENLDEMPQKKCQKTNSKDLSSDDEHHEEVIVNVEIPIQSTKNKSQETENTSTNTNDGNKTTEVQNKRDEFSIYGEYVANKLRNIPNAQARHTAEFHINGILYKAEMGEFDVSTSRDKTLTTTKTTGQVCTITIVEDDKEVKEEEEDEEDFITTILKQEIVELS